MLAFLLGNIHLKSAVWLFLTIYRLFNTKYWCFPLIMSKNSCVYSRTGWLCDTCMLSCLYKRWFCDILGVLYKYGTHSWETRTFLMTERARSWSRWRARFSLSVTVQGFAGQQQTRLPTPRCSRGTYQTVSPSLTTAWLMTLIWVPNNVFGRKSSEAGCAWASARRQGWIVVRSAARAMCFPKYINSANALLVGQTLFLL